MIRFDEVGLGRDEGDDHVVALGGLAGRVHLDAVRGGVERLEVVLELAKVRQLVVVARREAQDVFRRRNRLPARRSLGECGLRDWCRRPTQEKGSDDQREDQATHAGV